MIKSKAKIFYIFSALIFIAGGEVYGQRRKIENLPKFDQRRVHFGFTIGLNSANFVVNHQPDLSVFDSLRVIEGHAAPGFNLGIIADYHITPVFNIRFLPSLTFSQRNLVYTFASARTDFPINRVTKPVESTFIEFPLLLKYRSARLNNFAAYVVGGLNYRIDLASQEDVTPIFGEEIVKVIGWDLAYEIGVGFDFFMEYFKFSPEIKLSFGLPNILVRDDTMWTNPLRRLSSRILVISFHFEG